MKPTITENINYWDYKTMGVCMDGGSLSLIFLTTSGETKVVSLSQNVVADYYEEFDNLPARIYIDGEIVEKRSKEEKILIEYLENNVAKKMSKDELEMLNKKITFIKSDEYVNYTPIKLEISEKREKYLKLSEILQKYSINQIESKFLDLKNEIINIRDFEKWVNENEEIIINNSSQSIYNDLIILDYSNKHAKAELIKILAIDFRKLEFYQLCQRLENLICSENLRIENIRHSRDNSLYDPYSRYYFDFNINGIHIGMHNPFILNSSNYSIDDFERSSEFEKRFLNPNIFFELILSNLNSSMLKIVVEEELADVDSNDYIETFCGTKEDVVVQIDKHRIIMNKDFITSKMNKYWP